MNKHPELPKAFAELGLEVRFLKAAAKVGYVEPSPVQAELIPVALTGKDILGQARTGTGKTAAFAFPILQQIDPAGRLQALCLAPTRELAVQVAGETKRLAEFSNIHVVPVYGGQRIATQLHALGRRPHFVVGTPGRVMDMIGRGALDIAHVRFAVLDERNPARIAGGVGGTINLIASVVFVCLVLAAAAYAHWHAADQAIDHLDATCVLILVAIVAGSVATAIAAMRVGVARLETLEA